MKSRMASLTPRKTNYPELEGMVSAQHWVAVKQDGVTAALFPVDVPLVALGDIVRGTFAPDFGRRKGTVFSFVMNNYREDNFVAGQGGDFTFRYALTRLC